MARKGHLVRNVTRQECWWLSADLMEEGKEVYEYAGYTYGCVSSSGIAVSDQPDKNPFYEVPADSVSWRVKA